MREGGRGSEGGRERESILFCTSVKWQCRAALWNKSWEQEVPLAYQDIPHNHV